MCHRTAASVTCTQLHTVHNAAKAALFDCSALFSLYAERNCIVWCLLVKKNACSTPMWGFTGLVMSVECFFGQKKAENRLLFLPLLYMFTLAFLRNRFIKVLAFQKWQKIKSKTKKPNIDNMSLALQFQRKMNSSTSPEPLIQAASTPRTCCTYIQNHLQRD